MKTMLNMIKKPNETKVDGSAPVKAATVAAQKNEASVKAPQNAAAADFTAMTTRIQAFLNSGAQALAIAESKTDEVAKLEVGSAEYNRVVEEVKAFQARARQDFNQAETLLATATNLVKNKKS